MQLVNLKTGKPEQLADDAVLASLASGTHTPEGSRALINPEGQLVFSPLEDVHQNVGQLGYMIPTQEQLSEFANQQKYGEGFGNMAKAGLEGLGRGATFGATDYLAPAILGTDPEAISQRRERNPTTAAITEIGGAVGSGLLLPELAPAGLLSKAGAGVAARLAPEALTEGASLASQALNAAGRVGASAAGSAVEGAAYGLGQTVTEAALGDPDLNAEKILANVGYGALFGAGMGGMLKAGEIGIPATLTKAQDVIGKTYRKLVGGLDEAGEFAPGPLTKGIASAGEFATGEPAEDILEHAKKLFTGEGEVLSEKARREFYRDFNGAMEEHYQAINKASKEASTQIRPQESAALLADADTGAAFTALEDMRGTIRQTIAEMQAAPELYPARFPAKLEQILTSIDEKTRLPADTAARQYTAGRRAAKMDQLLPELSAADAFAAINEAKKALDTKIPWNKELSGEAADAIEKLKNLRGTVKSVLEDEVIWGAAGARTAAYNESLNEFLAAQKVFQTDFMKKVPTRSGGVTYRINPTKTNSFFNMINDPRGEIKNESLQNYLRTAKKLVDEIDKTYQSAAVEKFDKAAMEELLHKNAGMANRTRNIIQDQPNRGFGYVTDMFNTALAATGNPLGAVAMAAKSILDPHTTISRLSNLERAAQKSTAAISNASKSVFDGGASKARKLIGPAAGQMTEEAQRKQYERTSVQIEEYNTAPVKAIDKLDLATRDLYHVAPNISASMQMAAIRGNQFLAGKIPRSPKPLLPFDKPFVPSMPQMIKFNRYYQIVHRPLSALSELKAGHVYPETVETLQNVYPQLYDEMKTEILSSMSGVLAKEQTVPYQQRIAISSFIGSPLDSSMTPESVHANQMALAAQATGKAEEGAIKSTAKGMSNIGASGRLKTNLQDSATRDA